MQKITPNLWFNGNAKEAVDFYISVFKNSKILSTEHYPKSTEEGLADFQKDLAGKVLAIEFELDGVRFTAINAGPEFNFSEAVSFAIACEDQEEIDYFGRNFLAYRSPNNAAGVKTNSDFPGR